MKRSCFVFSVSLVFLTSVVLSSCGSSGSRFKINGRLLHISNGTMLVYSDADDFDHIDTIKIEAGRFAYDIDCKEPKTLVLVMPNFSQMPVFAQPGKKATIEGDAAHLKEMEIKGTKDNELMTAFRKQVATASPPETRKLAAVFVKEHAASPVSLWIVENYFVNNLTPDYKQAETLLNSILQQQSDKRRAKKLETRIKQLAKTTVGERLPSFSATDIRGKKVSSKDFCSGVCIIYTWASWSYESQNLVRLLHKISQETSGKVKVLGINIDATLNDCLDVYNREHIATTQISDGKLFETPLFNLLGFASVPDNMIVIDGKIAARSLNRMQLEERIENLKLRD